ncbi:MAG TPA: bifunctional rhamnulose-1-phosphate aldolase/short-chain dehydrogenase [Candidatus Sulfotelmatobacter sp.]|jgi:rhamnose utilization protein RhaD (predicted bifunctional aldolase and dehydrogenase)/NAD(P)-dependent dehydrogenase (short-subunit alcohol dehydrogenase family)|nr:bifunctional rhamnulose-1-phosphate aldolase/short-chain dehydrogenase [Candidatus Sulfotelmatobacter sp.]
MPEPKKTLFVGDLWDPATATKFDGNPLSLLRYRSNLLGADLRITNFGGGNTSSKMEFPDPFTGRSVKVLAVKGSGGDLGSITEAGFALLYQDRLEQLQALYKGEAFEDEMVTYYPLAAFGDNRVAASIDTPLHALLPFPHVDHLHPDWAIALAASANGKRKLEQFNKEYGRKIAWIPWQRPGFELALMLKRAVQENPGIDGILLGGHGLFTWGDTQRDCYLSSIHTIDQMGQFISTHRKKRNVSFGGLEIPGIPERKKVVAEILPTLRGAVSSNRRVIAHYSDHEDALTFSGSKWSRELSKLGTSCPDHFLRTRVCPLYLNWDPAREDVNALKASIQKQVVEYREDYKKYYKDWASHESPKLRDSNPSVVIIPGLGLVGFGKNKKEARITTEFFINAIHVMAGANALEDGEVSHPLPQARRPEQSQQFTQFHNYVALPRSEAFRIEYWALEEAKLQRMPAEAEFGRQVALVIGGASGIGREVAIVLARRGAHVLVADFDETGAKEVAGLAGSVSSAEFVSSSGADLSTAESLSDAVRKTILEFGGIDIVVNTAAIYPVAGSGGELSESQWGKAFSVNVTGNYLLTRAAEQVFREQALPASVVLTSSANAVVPKKGSEAYDTSKAALSHLIRELAIKLAPHVRVNGIAPATVVAGSSMFPRDRVMQSLQKYGISFADSESTDELRNKLADFYAQRTLTKRPISPDACAAAIVWLAGEQSSRTTGHVIPVDGGLADAFLR